MKNERYINYYCREHDTELPAALAARGRKILMKKSGRYNTSALIEDQFEPGSRGRVLKNLLGVKSKREMDEIEAAEHKRALNELLYIYDAGHRFTAADICKMHKIWLGGIYEWAGKYRQVNISKGGFMFAAANHIPRLMDAFEKGHLKTYTPCHFASPDEVAKALAVVHPELVLIHPFREGNGRLARMLAIIMGLQAALPPLDFSIISGKKRDEYFTAVQAGMDCNYAPMEKIFRDLLRRTFQG